MASQAQDIATHVSPAVPCAAQASNSPPMQSDGMIQEGVYHGALLPGAKDLFDAEFFRYIRRIRSSNGVIVASVTMFFQTGHIRSHFGSQLAVEIKPESVPSYVQEFFGVEVRIKDGVRLLQYPGGAQAEPDPSMTLRGFRPAKLSRIFQSEGCQAARGSPIFEREEGELQDISDVVSMTIPSRAVEWATVTVFLSDYRAAIIRTKLFG